MDSYEVTWERDTSGECPDVDEGNETVSGNITSYTITQLEEDSSYTINITATNAVDNVTSAPVTGITMEAGELPYSRKIFPGQYFHLFLPLN